MPNAHKTVPKQALSNASTRMRRHVHTRTNDTRIKERPWLHQTGKLEASPTFQQWSKKLKCGVSIGLLGSGSAEIDPAKKSQLTRV